MKALVYHGANRRAWEEKPKPALKKATDAIVRIPKTTICGTDLHIMKGDVPEVPDGLILGHEGVGVVGGDEFRHLGFQEGRQGADLLHHLVRKVRILQEGDVFALRGRRLDTKHSVVSN